MVLRWLKKKLGYGSPDTPIQIWHGDLGSPSITYIAVCDMTIWIIVLYSVCFKIRVKTMESLYVILCWISFKVLGTVKISEFWTMECFNLGRVHWSLDRVLWLCIEDIFGNLSGLIKLCNLLFGCLWKRFSFTPL